MSVKIKASDLTTRQKFAILKKELRRECLEREYHIDVLLALFISRQHGLFLGPPGTGKSMLLELACNAIDGRFFSYLVGESTKVDELYGAINPNDLRDKGIYRRNTANRLPEADIAYLDEIFKSSAGLLNMNLKLINERINYNPDPEAVPLRTMVGSSNELPDDDSLGAFVDRFVFKTWFDYLKSDDNILALWERSIAGHKSKIKIKLLEQDMSNAWTEASQLEVPLRLLLEIKKALELKSHVISDRKWLQVIKFLQAIAWVKKTTITSELLREILPDTIWLNPDDREEVAIIISDCIETIMQLPRNIEQNVDNIVTDLNNMTPIAIENGSWERRAIEVLRELENHKQASLKLVDVGIPKTYANSLTEHIELRMQEIKDALSNKDEKLARSMIAKVQKQALDLFSQNTSDVDNWLDQAENLFSKLNEATSKLKSLNGKGESGLNELTAIRERLSIAVREVTQL